MGLRRSTQVITQARTDWRPGPEINCSLRSGTSSLSLPPGVATSTVGACGCRGSCEGRREG